MITPGIVTFDPAAFKSAFPAFSTVPDAALQFNFGLATLQLNNSYSSVVQDEPTRAQLLNLLTAHFTAILNGTNGQAPTGVVGRVANATEGSVSVQLEFRTDSEAASFYAQSPFGALFWQLTVIYRTFRYASPACRNPSWDAWPQ
jgi:hypothetical protein